MGWPLAGVIFFPRVILLFKGKKKTTGRWSGVKGSGEGERKKVSLGGNQRMNEVERKWRVLGSVPGAKGLELDCVRWPPVLHIVCLCLPQRLIEIITKGVIVTPEVLGRTFSELHQGLVQLIREITTVSWIFFFLSLTHTSLKCLSGQKQEKVLSLPQI